MKITKINTKIGEFGAPVSVELNAVVERMCSSRNKETADRIAAIALKSRLMMQQGMPHNTRKTTSGLPLPATISVSASRQVTHSQTAHFNADYASCTTLTFKALTSMTAQAA